MNLLDHIKSLLEQNESFRQDGRLFKNSVVESAQKLDKNQLYVNSSDMQDVDHQISKENEAINHQFYQS